MKTYYSRLLNIKNTMKFNKPKFFKKSKGRNFMINRKNILRVLFSTFLLFAFLIISPHPASAACIDNDADGYGNPGDASCPRGSATDCDDTDPKVYPGATKICDGKDNNCDGKLDFLTDVDNDHDGVPVCASDCDDNNPNRFPGNI